MHKGQAVGGGCSGVEGGWLTSLHGMEEERAVRAGKLKGSQTKGSARISCKNV